MTKTITRRSPTARYPGDLQLGGFVDRDTMQFIRDYPHPPALVWAALTDPAQIGVWLWPCTSFEARLGGVGVFNPGREFHIAVTEFEPSGVRGLSWLGSRGTATVTVLFFA